MQTVTAKSKPWSRFSLSDQLHSWETDEGRSYFIPAVEILAYEVLLNLYARNFDKYKDDFNANGDTFWRNLTEANWVIDNDQFNVNQFLHPYGGNLYHGLARSAGLSFWESFIYTGLGSLLWEIGGEATPPSINDQVSTSFGGSFLGEPLFRLSNLLLEKGGERPGWLHELGAAIISPPTGLNRLIFGDRFDAVFPSRRPAMDLRLQIGATLTSSRRNVPSSINHYGGALDVSVGYGLPGKPGYKYERPFDYFNFRFTAVTANTFESILTRGLLYGTDYRAGAATRGIWGVYGSYDYISPQNFRVSSTALTLGTTWQSWLSDIVALQGTALGGVGYAAGGNTRRNGNRDYHYGVAPQTLLNLRLIFADRLLFDLTGREYFVSDLGGTQPDGWENIARADAMLTARIFEQHGISLRYVLSSRNARYMGFNSPDQWVGTFSLMYAYVGETNLGAVEWRN